LKHQLRSYPLPTKGVRRQVLLFQIRLAPMNGLDRIKPT